MVDKCKVGIIGVGNIAPRYIAGCRQWDILELAAVADIDVERAKRIAAEHEIPQAGSVDDLLANPDIDIVINLTVPLAHAEVSLKILEAGKHVHTEKPLAVTLEDAKKIMETAAARDLRVGSAPDTFMFAAQQTCRKLIDDGMIGTPVAAVGFMFSHGPESWHPNPYFFYQFGGGPMLDMGPYYVTCMINLLGGVRRVTGSARKSFPERIATSKELNGKRIPVEVPTHYAAVLDFESGAVGTLVMSFDIWSHNLPNMEIYGSEGTLQVPDPNGYNNKILLRRHDEKEFHEIPLAYPTEWARGIGVADLAYGIRTGRPHRASGALAYHALEVMSAVESASNSGAHVHVQSQVIQPAAVPLHLPPRQLDS